MAEVMVVAVMVIVVVVVMARMVVAVIAVVFVVLVVVVVVLLLLLMLLLLPLVEASTAEAPMMVVCRVAARGFALDQTGKEDKLVLIKLWSDLLSLMCKKSSHPISSLDNVQKCRSCRVQWCGTVNA
jgi:hypothetical protein